MDRWALCLLLMATACGGDAVEVASPADTNESPTSTVVSRVTTTTPTSTTSTVSQGERVTFDELLDPDTDLDGVTGIDLEGELQPTGPAFCDAFGLIPMRWLRDAVFPLQAWLDAFPDSEDVPQSAVEPLARLTEFAETRMAWNFGQAERPEFTEELRNAASAVVDAAVEHCPDLPMVVGRPGISDEPSGWADVSDQQKDHVCQGELDRVDEAIADYERIFGAVPSHQQQLETSLPEESFFWASEFVGVRVDENGRASAAPVPDGACDR